MKYSLILKSYLIIFFFLTIILLQIPINTSQYLNYEEYDFVTFTNLTNEAGFKGVGMSNPAWGDYDNDGDEDLLLNGGSLFRNNGPPYWNFTDVTEETGLTRYYSGVFGDYDNDGYLDIFTCTSNPTVPEILWHNNGDGTFTDVTAESGIVDDYNTPAAGWGDYDDDGFIDLYIANYEGSGSGGSGLTNEPLPDFLWHNNGDGTFTDVSDSTGLRDEEDHCGRGVEWGDFDNDGDLDIYISNYRLNPNLLWENQGDGTFKNVAEEKGVDGVRRYSYYDEITQNEPYYGHTIGSSWGDINNDGNLDLFVANLVHKDVERGKYCDDSKMYLNLGEENDYVFEDLRPNNGMPYKDYMGGEDELWSGVTWGDFNNDGFLDLFVTSVYTDIDYAHTYLFKNNGDNTFTDYAVEAGVRVWANWGTSSCDYDNDGDLDIIVNGKDGIDAANNPSYVHLFRNDGKKNHKWLNVKIDGGMSENGESSILNQAGIGARITVTTKEGISQIREVEGGMGTCSNQNSLECEFGFGEYSDTVDIEIGYSRDKTLSFEDIDLNQNCIVNIRSGEIEFQKQSQKSDKDSDGDNLGTVFGIVFLGAIISGSVIYFQNRVIKEFIIVFIIAILILSPISYAVIYEGENENGIPKNEYSERSHHENITLLGLTEVMGEETFEFEDYLAEDESLEIKLNLDYKNIASLIFKLDWEDESDLVPMYGNDNLAKNMGDLFAINVTTPWDSSIFISPQINNYHLKPGHLEYILRSDDVPIFNYQSFPDAETGGDFIINIELRDCGDHREFGNFGPQPSELITEDSGNDWRLEVGYTVWEE